MTHKMIKELSAVNILVNILVDVLQKQGHIAHLHNFIFSLLYHKNVFPSRNTDLYIIFSDYIIFGCLDVLQ